eukprot:308049-Rhodomonas_salina.1
MRQEGGGLLPGLTGGEKEGGGEDAGEGRLRACRPHAASTLLGRAHSRCGRKQHGTEALSGRDSTLPSGGWGGDLASRSRSGRRRGCRGA